MTPRKLLIVSHVPHYSHQGGLFAYGPYAREIDIWADLFPEVTIAAPLRAMAPPHDATAFSRTNIVMAPIVETGGDCRRAKLWQLVQLPRLVWQLWRAMRRAEAVHIRGPGNVGLLGALLAPLASRFRVAKYAGQWNGYPGERAAVRWQRWLLKSRWWNAPVTVYGDWPDQPLHVVPFFTSMMTRAQVEEAGESADQPRPHRPLRILFSGRLAEEKRVGALLEALGHLHRAQLPFVARIVGDGPLRFGLTEQARRLGISDCVEFRGGLPFDRAIQENAWADCLVLPSQHSEGWPKVVAEAMCYGLLCIAVDHGQLHRMLQGRGVLLAKGTPEEIAKALIDFARNPAQYEDARRAAAQWARQYSLDGLREALAKVLSQAWNVSISSPEAGTPSLDSEGENPRWASKPAPVS